MKYQVLLYYKYVAVEDPEAEKFAQRELCETLGIKGRILISAEGINGTLAGTLAAVRKYQDTMSAHPLFSSTEYKESDSATMPFPRLRIKVRDEVVTLGKSVDLQNSAPKLNATEFDEIIKNPDVVLFDARNNYESAIGKFKNAVTPDIQLFKDLPGALKDYEDLKDKTIVTYCTGGIRCEKASALMKERGFNDVYQLDGGIIKYAQANPNGAFEGECFVFDERMKVAFDSNPEQLGSCISCSANTNDYYNCAYKPCNKLILICPECRSTVQNCEDTSGHKVALL